MNSFKMNFYNDKATGCGHVKIKLNVCLRFLYKDFMSGVICQFLAFWDAEDEFQMAVGTNLS